MTVIFFCPNILRDAHRRIFHLDRLIDLGYNVIFLDATQFYNHKSTATDKLILERTVICSSLKDFINLKEGMPQNPVLYVSFDQYMKFAAPVLKILKRKQDKILTYHTKRFSSIFIPEDKSRLLLDKVIKKFDKVLPLYLFKFWYKLRHKHFTADYFLCSTHYLIPTKIFLSVKPKNRFVVHSDDINQTLENQTAVIAKNRRIGVFLDQMIPYQTILHSGIQQEVQPENYKEMYYRDLETILKKAEKQLNLDEVVIALHPDAVKYQEEVNYNFRNFRTFIGSTHELIRDSAVVFGHSSTALGWAIYYKKPVLLLKEKYLMRQLMGKYVNFFQNRLNMDTLNMEDSEFTLSEVFIDKEKYEDYNSKYLKDNNINENSYVYAIKRIVNDLQK